MSQFAHYCGYTAIVALYVYVIKRCTSFATSTAGASTNFNNFGRSTWTVYFEAASNCQEQIKNSSKIAKESFAQKCSVVLEEMRDEAVAKILRVQNNESSDGGQDEWQSLILSMDYPRQETFTNQRREAQMEETAFFGREWNDINFVSLSDFYFPT